MRFWCREYRPEALGLACGKEDRDAERKRCGSRRGRHHWQVVKDDSRQSSARRWWLKRDWLMRLGLWVGIDQVKVSVADVRGETEGPAVVTGSPFILVRQIGLGLALEASAAAKGVEISQGVRQDWGEGDKGEGLQSIKVGGFSRVEVDEGEQGGDGLVD